MYWRLKHEWPSLQEYALISKKKRNPCQFTKRQTTLARKQPGAAFSWWATKIVACSWVLVLGKASQCQVLWSNFDMSRLHPGDSKHLVPRGATPILWERLGNGTPLISSLEGGNLFRSLLEFSDPRIQSSQITISATDAGPVDSVPKGLLIHSNTNIADLDLF
jgi:hypothetical protein